MNLQKIQEKIDITDKRISKADKELKYIKCDIDMIDKNIKNANDDLEKIKKSMIDGTVFLADELKAEHMAKRYIERCEKKKKERERIKKEIMFELMELINYMIELEKSKKEILEYSDSDFYEETALWDTEPDEGSEDPLLN